MALPLIGVGNDLGGVEWGEGLQEVGQQSTPPIRLGSAIRTKQAIGKSCRLIRILGAHRDQGQPGG